MSHEAYTACYSAMERCGVTAGETSDRRCSVSSVTADVRERVSRVCVTKSPSW